MQERNMQTTKERKDQKREVVAKPPSREREDARLRRSGVEVTSAYRWAKDS